MDARGSDHEKTIQEKLCRVGEGNKTKFLFCFYQVYPQNKSDQN